MQITRVIIYTLTIVLAIAIGYMPFFEPWVFVYSLIILGTLFIIWKYAKQEDRAFLLILFILGITIRIGMLILLYTHATQIEFEGFFSEGFLSGDAKLYSMRALEIANFWKDSFSHILSSKKYGLIGYTYFLAFIYYIFGYNPLIVKFINCFFGSIAFIAFYFLAKNLFDIKVARLTGILLVFFPSLIRWSATGLKDPLIILSLGVTLLFILKIYRTRNPFYLAPILFFWLVLNSIQVFLAKIFIPALCISIFYLTHRLSKETKKGITLVILILFLIFAFKPYFGNPPYPLNFFQYIAAKQEAQAVADDAGYSIYDKTDPNATGVKLIIIMLKGMFKGFFYSFFSPFPWKISSAGQTLAYPQVILWYLLFPFLIFGILKGIKENKIEITPIVLYVLFFVLIFASSEGNIGAAFRHRDMITPLFLIFISLGLIRAFERFKHEGTIHHL